MHIDRRAMSGRDEVAWVVHHFKGKQARATIYRNDIGSMCVCSVAGKKLENFQTLFKKCI